MRWFGWFRAKPVQPEIPGFTLPVDIKPLEPKDPDYVVGEVEMSETGMFRLFPWRKKSDDE